VIFNGMYYSSTYAMIFGFFSGLALDVSSYPLFGFYSLIYATLGYLTSIPEKKFEFGNLFTTSILVVVFFIIKGVLFLLIGLVFLRQGEVWSHFKNVYFLQLFYTILASIPIFFLYKKIVQILEGANKNG